MNKMTVGERIKYRRQELGMTQEEMAKKMGVSFQLISRYENNAVDTIPTLHHRKQKRRAIKKALPKEGYIGGRKEGGACRQTTFRLTF